MPFYITCTPNLNATEFIDFGEVYFEKEVLMLPVLFYITALVFVVLIIVIILQSHKNVLPIVKSH
jgi:hypothetical protein